MCLRQPESPEISKTAIPFIMHRINRLTNQLNLKASSSSTSDDLLNHFIISSTVQKALDQGNPIVALESTIITHGMSYPSNMHTALQVETVIRNNGAVPATIAILKGKIHIGLTRSQLEDLAELGQSCRKCSRRDLAYIVASKENGATTVAATMYCAYLAGIDIFVTGGIGGVHRGVERTMDISADLKELGKTPITVICAGPKSILDIGRTLQVLETEGVPVIVYDSKEIPAFFTRSSGYKAHLTMKYPKEIANVIKTSKELKLSNGTIVAVPVPKEDEAETRVIEQAIHQALKECDEKEIQGHQVTPYLLERVAQLTDGESLKANIKLILNNARIGAQIAVELTESCRPLVKNCAASVLVIGGAGTDVLAQIKPNTIHHLQTSNLGQTIEEHFGGVGRNIAEGIARLGGRVTLLSAVGTDWAGQKILAHCENVGISTKHILQCAHQKTGRYVAIHSSKDLVIAVENFAVLKELNIEYLKSKLDLLMNHSLIVLDGNLPPHVLKYILTHIPSTTEVWYEPISTVKALKIIETDSLSKVTYLSPNLEELVMMALALKYQTCDFAKLSESFQQLQQTKEYGTISFVKEHARIVVEHNVPHLMVTLGAKGVAYFQKASLKMYAAHPLQAPLVNTNGAGDSFVSGCVYGLTTHHLRLSEAIEYGLYAASVSVISSSAISDRLQRHIKI